MVDDIMHVISEIECMINVCEDDICQANINNTIIYNAGKLDVLHIIRRRLESCLDE